MVRPWLTEVAMLSTKLEFTKLTWEYSTLRRLVLARLPVKVVLVKFVKVFGLF